MSDERPGRVQSGRNAVWVGAGIMASRVFGLLRTTLFSHAFGTSTAAGAFSAALRIPNFLQNLLGEGVLSASFIPVYAGLRAQGRHEEADDVASTVFGLLLLAVLILVPLGVLFTPELVVALAPGFEGPVRELTVSLVRLIFPGTGVMVLSAWCLGILNSHRRFFLSYSAGVVWNGAMIAALLLTRGVAEEAAIHWVAWGFVVGGVLQVAAQLPATLRLLGRFGPRLEVLEPSVQQVLKGFLPVAASRGVVQISAYADNAYSSLISARAVAALTSTQTISLLPISLFAMAITAAELPELSSEAGQAPEARSRALRERLAAGLERMAFFVVPSAAGFLAAGDAMAAVLLQSGAFPAADTRYAWYILAGAGVGLLAQTSGRLYSSVFYALKDTATPFRFAALRVGLGVGVGYWAVRILPGQLGLPAHLGAAFVTLTSGLTAWVEVTLLRRSLAEKLGELRSIRGRLAALWACAGLAAAITLLAKVGMVATWGPMGGQGEEWLGSVLPLPALPVSVLPQKLAGLTLLFVYGVSYLSLTLVAGIPESCGLAKRLFARK